MVVKIHRKILDHPDKNLIIRKLMNGEGVRKVAKWLQERHPNDKTRHLSVPTLQTFRKDHLKIEGEALEIIKTAEKEKKVIRDDNREEKKISKEIKNLPSYQEKLKEAVGLHIDIRQQLANLHMLISSRIEDLFDKLAHGEATVSDEVNLQKYFQTYILALEKWAKYIDKVADYTIETNVNVTVIEDQMALMREAVWEILHNMEPILATRFLEKLSLKMSNMSYRTDKSSFNKINSDIKVLTSNVEDVDG
jgi:hypothetical protein